MTDQLRFHCDLCLKPIQPSSQGVFYITKEDFLLAKSWMEQARLAEARMLLEFYGGSPENLGKPEHRNPDASHIADHPELLTEPPGSWHIRHEACAHPEEEAYWDRVLSEMDTFPRLLGTFLYLLEKPWIGGTDLQKRLRKYAHM